MKQISLLFLSLLVSLSGIAQRPELKAGLPVKKHSKISMEYLKPGNPVRQVAVPDKTTRNPGAVTVIDLGTSADLSGYSLGTRTMLWADDDLNVVMNIHRMGPGTTPPGLEGYLAMDLGMSMGKTPADWTTQVQVQSSVMAASPFYYDAASYPAAGIYNPPGNTNLSNARVAWFNANHANMAFSGFGGYGYGTASLTAPGDTTKHVRWYNGHPFTNNPSGFAIGSNGIVHVVDGEYKMVSGELIYQDSIVYGRGVWDPATKDFDFTFQTLAFPCKDSYGIADCKVATSLGGYYVWISVLTNSPEGEPQRDSTLFPVLRNSSDAGLTWSPTISVILDGPNGIDGIKNAYSDYFIANLFAPPLPTRDEIPYTAAFDHSITVDKWGLLHIGIVVGYAPGGYGVLSGIDSINNVFDIVICSNFMSTEAIRMGSLRTFRGTWDSVFCDNRVYISRTKGGDKIFVTWNDTHIDSVADNLYPDVYARGFDLIMWKLTDNDWDSPHNVTALSNIANEAYFQCSSPVVFTDNNKYTLPICTQWFSNPGAGALFRYISDFSFTDPDFTFPVTAYPWIIDCDWIGIDRKEETPAEVEVFPNPAENIINITFDLKREENVSLEMTNLLGKKVLTIQKGKMATGHQQFTVNVNNLPPGIYFVSVSADARRFSKKLVIQ